MNETPTTTTQKLWKPISMLQAEQEEVGRQLRAAALAGDIEAAKKAAGRMEELQREMHQAGQSVREHARQKAQAASKSAPDRSNYPAIGQMLQHSLEHAIKTGVIKVPGINVSTTDEDHATQA
jgi:ElaB/YqjD/DUF883 family membrane-anchored ribosome-binding protein